MRVFFAWMVPAAVALAACGGKVVLDDASGTGAASGMGGSAGTGIAGGSATGGAGVAGGGVGPSGTGGDCVPTCKQALATGGAPCNVGNELTDYKSLQLCAGCTDTGNCEGLCGASLCTTAASSDDCTSCLQTNCAAEYFACQTGSMGLGRPPPIRHDFSAGSPGGPPYVAR